MNLFWYALLCGATISLGDVAALADPYVPVPIGDIANMAHTDIEVSSPFGTYDNLPVGEVEFGCVPFSIPPTGYNVWNSELEPRSNPKVQDVNVDIFGVKEVHILINSGWGQPGPASYASMEFYGSLGDVYVETLIGNDDIRDWLNALWTNFINGVWTVNVWTEGNARLDKMTVKLPEEFQDQELATVRFIDNGAVNFQRIFVVGLTVRLAAESECPADTNGDELIDPLDSGYVLARLGCPVGAGDACCTKADANEDGLVDPLDVGFVLARLGEDCGS